MFKVLLDHQATPHVFKNEALMSNIWTGSKAIIGGGSQTGMSTIRTLRQ